MCQDVSVCQDVSMDECFGMCLWMFLYGRVLMSNDCVYGSQKKRNVPGDLVLIFLLR
jgi:hypothetical protein